MKMKKLQKGFTLVEILVAVCLFGITCAILFTAILFAIKSNKENVYAGREIQMQMNSAENYDNEQTLFDNNVAPFRIDGDNKVKLKVNFATTSDGTATGHSFSFTNKEVYAYQANAGFEDHEATYNMRFFESKSAKPYDPDSGKWWVRLHNFSVMDLSREVYINPVAGVSIYDPQKKSLGTHWSKTLMADSTGAIGMQFGLDLSHYDSVGKPSILFIGEWYNDFYNSSYVVNPAEDLELTSDNIDKYKELDSTTGEPTGYIDIYYDGTAVYSKAEFAAAYPELGL